MAMKPKVPGLLKGLGVTLNDETIERYRFVSK